MDDAPERPTGLGLGAGRRLRHGAGHGAGGTCICVRCGTRLPHQRGEPCLDRRCPDCGAAMMRESSPRHREVVSRRAGPAGAGQG